LPKNKTSKKIKRKFRLLLDSAFARPQTFPHLSKKANLAHAVLDCGLPPQAEDQEVYQKAIETGRFVLTINFNHFKKLVKNKKSGAIAIESQLTNDEIDKKVSDFVAGKNPDDFLGKTTKI